MTPCAQRREQVGLSRGQVQSENDLGLYVIFSYLYTGLQVALITLRITGAYLSGLSLVTPDFICWSNLTRSTAHGEMDAECPRKI